MNKRIVSLDDFNNEGEVKNVVDENKLIEVAKAIALFDDYGLTYWCKDTNEIVFVVGDGCPLDMDHLIDNKIMHYRVRKGDSKK
jgi:hypothetical protein